MTVDVHLSPLIDLYLCLYSLPFTSTLYSYPLYFFHIVFIFLPSSPLFFIFRVFCFRNISAGKRIHHCHLLERVFIGITGDEACVDNLNPLFVLTHVNKLGVTGDCRWDVVVSPHACFRVLPGASRASLCTLLVCLVGHVIRTAVLTCQSLVSELIDQHSSHFRFDGS